VFFFIAILKTIGRPEVPSGFVFCLFNDTLDYFIYKLDVIALQEIWDIKYPELVSIDGYKPLIFKKRRGMRGGGVGFFVKNCLSVEILENFSPFENKIIEALTIQLSYPSSNQPVLLTCIYRSNGPIPNVTASQQMDRFIEKFSNLLADLKTTKKLSFVFTDSNINLLNLQSAENSNFLNSLLANGYLQCISKATQIQNASHSLIDHVLFNHTNNNVLAGTLISDVSDHFFTFIMPISCPKANQQIHKSIVSRDFSHQNLERFKLELSLLNWDNVLAQTNVDLAYEAFWTIYLENYNRTFALKRLRFNKNINKRQNFITRGILVSRKTKQVLHKKAISSPSAENIANYKNYLPKGYQGGKKIILYF
jgi:hypothetical protein